MSLNLIGEPWTRCPRRKLTPLVKARLKELAKMKRAGEMKIAIKSLAGRFPLSL